MSEVGSNIHRSSVYGNADTVQLSLKLDHK